MNSAWRDRRGEVPPALDGLTAPPHARNVLRRRRRLVAGLAVVVLLLVVVLLRLSPMWPAPSLPQGATPLALATEPAPLTPTMGCPTALLAPARVAVAGDGHRLVVVRGGTDGGAWTSSDGLGWQQVPVTGDIPAAQATQAVLLPGGVLLSDATTTWFGEAVTK